MRKRKLGDRMSLYSCTQRHHDSSDIAMRSEFAASQAEQSAQAASKCPQQ
jgi:hypothetical protein